MGSKSLASRGLIFRGEEISIPETRPIRKSYIFILLEKNPKKQKQTKLSEAKRVAQNVIINTEVLSQKKIVIVPHPNFSII